MVRFTHCLFSRRAITYRSSVLLEIGCLISRLDLFDGKLFLELVQLIRRLVPATDAMRREDAAETIKTSTLSRPFSSVLALII